LIHPASWCRPSTLGSGRSGRHHGQQPSFLVADWNLPLTADGWATATGALSS